MGLKLYIDAGKFVRKGCGSVKLFNSKNGKYIYAATWKELLDALDKDYEPCKKDTWRF